MSSRWRPLHALAWVVLALLAVAVAVRVLAPDRGSAYFVLLAGLTPLLYLPAWGVLVAAFGMKRWPLTAAAAALVAVHALWLAPVVTGGRGPLRDAGLHVRVLALNMHASARTGAATQRVVDRLRPDVIVLSEASPTSLAGLTLAGYPAVWSQPSTETEGWLVASRWPLVDRRIVELTGQRSMPRVTLRRPDGGTLVVWQVHPTAPISGSVQRWREQLRDIRAAVHDLSGSAPAITAGDFNATRDMPPFGRLLEDGWADALDGRGLLATWRASGRIVPPVLRLDHVLVSRQVGVRRVMRIDVGSDHLGLVIDLDLATTGA